MESTDRAAALPEDVLFEIFSRVQDSRDLLTYDELNAGDLFLGLCNPITGERHVVPPLDCACLGRYENGHAILTSADLNSPSSGSGWRRSTFSQLLVTVPGHRHQDDRHLHLHARVLRRHAQLEHAHHSESFRLEGTTAAVVHRGLARWLYTRRDGLYMLASELATARVSFTKLPISAGWSSSFLCLSGDAKLSVASAACTPRTWTFGRCKTETAANSRRGGSALT